MVAKKRKSHLEDVQEEAKMAATSVTTICCHVTPEFGDGNRCSSSANIWIAAFIAVRLTCCQ